MKLVIFAISICIIAGAHAQDAATVQLSQNEAVREFPDLAKANSTFNQRFLARYTALKGASDPLLLRDGWPLILAKQIAMELGVEPAAASPNAAPSATPWVQHGTMLDHDNSVQGASLLTPADKKYSIRGTVIQRTGDGLLVECKGRSIGYESVAGDIWLTGIDAQEDKSIRVTAIKVGTYEYTTVDGAARMVDEYRALP